MKKISYYLIIIIVIGAGLVSFWSYQKYFQKEEPNLLIFKVERGDIKEAVKVRGEVVAQKEFDLEFPYSGTVEEIFVKAGQPVKQGDALIKIETTDFELEEKKLQSQLKQARANFDSAGAILNQLKAGASDENIEVARKNVDSARTAYDNAVKNLATLENKTAQDNKTYEEAVGAAQTALTDKNTNLEDVKNTYSQNIANLEASAITSMSSSMFTATAALDTADKSLTNNNAFTLQQGSIYISQTNNNYFISAKNSYNEALDFVGRREIEITILEYSVNDNVEEVLNSSINTLNKVKQTLSLAYTALQNTVATTNYSQADIDANKASLVANQASIETAIAEQQTAEQNLIDANIAYDSQVNTAQATLNTAQDNLTTARANLSAAEANGDLQIATAEAKVNSTLAALNLAKSRLELKKAPPRQVDLASQEAQVSKFASAITAAETQIEIINEKIGKSTLNAPLDAKIVKIWLEDQELFKLGQTAISLSTAGHKIQTDISELEIGKVRETNGNDVLIRLDAFDDYEFKGKVVSVDPREVIKDGDRYYRVNIFLAEHKAEVRSGMSADLTINVSSKNNVLKIPEFAIYEKDDKRFVKILEGETQKEIEIETGISDGESIEVVKGLSEDQTIVVSAD